MGISKRSLSPDVNQEEMSSGSDEVVFSCPMAGQEDIRRFCVRKSSEGKFAKVNKCATPGRSCKELNNCSKDESDADKVDVGPLVRLPGQQDIREAFLNMRTGSLKREQLKNEDRTNFGQMDEFKADEEGAASLGLPLDLSGAVIEKHDAVLELEELEDADKMDEFKADEEGAASLGLPLDLSDADMEKHEAVLDPEDASEIEEFNADEEAAVSLGLPLDLSDADIEKHEAVLEPEDASEVEDFKADEEAATSLGLPLDFTDVDMEKHESDYELDPEADQDLDKADILRSLAADEESARTMGHSFTMDADGMPMRPTGQKGSFEVEISASSSAASPATPPKRLLKPQLTDDKIMPQFKRRRVTDDLGKDAAARHSSDEGFKGVQQPSSIKLATPEAVHLDD